MLRSRRSTVGLLAAFALGLTVSCGDPFEPGLGSVSVNGGGNVEVTFGTPLCSVALDPACDPDADTVPNYCDAQGIGWFFRIFVEKSGANLGPIEFGADTVLDIFEQPPVTERISNAVVAVANVGGLLVQHSNTPSANWFIDPNLVLNDTGGPRIFSTGDNGVSWIGVHVPLGTPAAVPDGGISFDFSFEPLVNGEPLEATFTFDCELP